MPYFVLASTYGVSATLSAPALQPGHPFGKSAGGVLANLIAYAAADISVPLLVSVIDRVIEAIVSVNVMFTMVLIALMLTNEVTPA